MTDRAYFHKHWQSADGLTLHFRDYPASGEGSEGLPVVCLHGLTRNARDFEDLAPHIAAQGRRVIVPEMRGRGRSAYATDPSSYAVPTYVGDVLALLEQENIARCLAIGTSMGGLIIMALGAIDPARIAGFVLNDVGPVVEPEGIERIRAYVGQGGSYPTWVHAARALAEVHGDMFPDYTLEQWLMLAKRTMVLVSNGRIAFDYDMKIAEPLMTDSETAVPPDLWPLLELLRDRPAVLVRGEKSAILSAQTQQRMAEVLPGARTLVIPGIGHAPTLDEAPARAAIDAMLAEAP